ncbi:complement C1q-like protein 2 [Saccostrea echinata]|uniref:complement C1q-like protein 2 n=1 Tax=Saccostrea echinata TaxID=191078 RepID=UPI002A837F19|nr:complement C1q-like protein 2 [Saccostrea echinata]
MYCAIAINILEGIEIIAQDPDGYTDKLRITAFTLVLLVIHTTFIVAETSTPTKFIKEFDGYMSVCQRVGWGPKKGCASVGHVIAFHAAIKSHLSNVPVNTIIKYEDVLLNKGKGYDPKTGIFTAPEDGVYFFEWTFITTKKSSVYIEAVVDGVRKASTCVYHQQSNHVSTSGHLLYELKRGNKVWIRTFYITAGYMYADKYTYFSGYKISYF